MINQLTFNNSNLAVIDLGGQIWLKSAELAKALGYSDLSSVNRIYNRNEVEFTPEMTSSVKLTDPNGIKQETRIFSLRGCHLIAMFARTKIAQKFRIWVLDKLEEEERQLPYQVTVSATAHIPHEGRWVVRYMDGKVEVKNIDGKSCVDHNLFMKLQQDAAFYRDKLELLTKQLKEFTALSSSFAERTRITSGECSKSVFNIPLKQIA